MKDSGNAQEFLDHFKISLPKINYNLHEFFKQIIDIIIPEGNLIDLNASLNCINQFESIEPSSVFAQIKQALGINLNQSIEFYHAQIENLYKNERDFHKALQLARECEEIGAENLIHYLAECCAEANDWNNLIAVLSVDHTIAPEAVFEIAHSVYVDPDISQVEDRRERLKTAMRLFDLCASLQEASTLKAQIFYELAGGSISDPHLVPLTGFPAKYLCQIAEVLFPLNQLVKSQQEQITRLSKTIADFNLTPSLPNEYEIATVNWNPRGATLAEDVKPTEEKAAQIQALSRMK